MKIKNILITTLLLAFQFCSIVANADVLPRPDPNIYEYAKAVKFTVAGYTGENALTNFPVLVRISEEAIPGLQYSDFISKNGSEICFLDMDGNGLPYEIDTWNPNDTSLAWVKLPILTNGVEFVMCYQSSGDGKQICPENPWDNFTGVWHMNESANGAIDILDSTDNNLIGVAHPTSSSKTDGMIGGARFITTSDTNTSATDKGIVVDLQSDATKLAAVDAITPEFSVSMWIRPQKTTSRFWYLVSRKANDATPAWGLQFNSDDSNFSPFRVYSAGASDKQCTMANVSGITAKNWSKLDINWKQDGTYEIYINGALSNSGKLYNLALAKNGTLNLAIGGGVGHTNGQKGARGFYGDMDEVRIRKGAIDAEWVATDYAMINNPEFLTAEEPVSFGKLTTPIVSLSVTDITYTNATFNVETLSLGEAANELDIQIEFSLTEDFSTIAKTFTPDAKITGLGTVSYVVKGLDEGTYYYARITGSNDKEQSASSSACGFKTQAAYAPELTAALKDVGFSTLNATAEITSSGIENDGCTAYLEVSTTEDFSADVITSEPVDVSQAETISLELNNLSPNTVYYCRVRSVNFFEKTTIIELPTVETYDMPIVVNGIDWEATDNIYTISFGVDKVFDSAELSAVLTFNGITYEEKQFSSPTTLEWTGIPTCEYATVVVTVTATVNGNEYTRAWEQQVTLGQTSSIVKNIFDYDTAEEAIRLKVGDMVTVPEKTIDGFYAAGNPLFIELNGNVATALRPGITSIQLRSTPSNVVHSLPIIIMPDAIEGGDVYIFNESASGTQNSKAWDSSVNWEKLDSDTNDSYPCKENDIAIIPFYNTKSITMNLANDIVLGGLYLGQFGDTNGHLVINGINSTNRKKVSFKRTDGNPVLIQLSANTTDLDNNSRKTQLTFGSNLHTSEFLTDTHLNGGWANVGPRKNQGRFVFEAKTNSIPEGVTVSLYDMDTQGQNMGTTISLGALQGGGTFWNRSSAMVRFSTNISGFTGVLRASGGMNAGDESRTGPLFIRTSSATNCSAEVIGWVGRHTDGDPSASFKNCCGSLVLGWNHFYNAQGPHDPYFPKKGLLMHNSLFYNGIEYSSVWTNIVDYRIADKLTINGGFNFIKGNASDGYPLTWFEAKALEHNGKATVRIDDASHYTLASTATKTNQVTIINGIESHLVGKGENPEESSAYSIVPWMISPGISNDNGDSDPIFATFNKENRLIRQKYSTQNLNTYGENDNAYCKDKDIAISENITLNSLVLNNSGKSRTKTLGADKTLTIKSGGLILYGNNTSIGTAEGGIENGKLVLGDENLPAYVWATRSSEESPIQIWAETTAKGGFVSAYTGFLRLGGNQTGIAKEIIVNAGTLILGNATEPCLLANDLPISIYANAVLSLPNADSTKNTIINFEGCADWYGKIEIPEGVDALCMKIYTRDYPEFPEFISLARGRYTGDEATAKALDCIYDPVHFSGSGTITVTSDDTTIPTTIVIW